MFHRECILLLPLLNIELQRKLETHIPLLFSQYTHECYSYDNIIERVDFAGEHKCENCLPLWQEHPECTLNAVQEIKM